MEPPLRAAPTMPPSEQRANAAPAPSISPASRKLIGLPPPPPDGATAWITANWPIPEVAVGSRRTAARVTPGAICLSNSSHFPLKLYSYCIKPVALPPGRARLSTKLQLHLPRHQHCANLQVARRALPPHPLEHFPPMLLPILSQIEQKALVERSARSLRRAARVSSQRETRNSFSMSAIIGCVNPALRNSATSSAMTCSHSLASCFE